MLRYLTGLLLAALPFLAFAQTGDTRMIDLEGANTVHIQASFSSVSLTSGGQAAVSVNHLLTTNGQDRPELRELEIVREGGVLKIRELKPTVETLKKEFPSRNGNVQTNGKKGGKGTFNGAVVNAVLEVVIPLGVQVIVETEYGSIIATNVPGLIEARAKYGSVDVIFTDTAPRSDLDLYSNYGAVDVTLPPGQGADVDLTTKYGDLLTDLDIAINTDVSREREFFQRVVGVVEGGGAQVRCKAPYGDVYLRSAK